MSNARLQCGKWSEEARRRGGDGRGVGSPSPLRGVRRVFNHPVHLTFFFKFNLLLHPTGQIRLIGQQWAEIKAGG